MLKNVTAKWLSLLKLGSAVLLVATMSNVACVPRSFEPSYPQPMIEVESLPEPPSSVSADSEGTDVSADSSAAAETDPSALTAFNAALEGHGEWVEDATYGTVWVPSRSEVGDEFQPYVTAGHWTVGDDREYVWVSDYVWGWAPFHYGRWVYVSARGWVWIPGRRYAGAWVVWNGGAPGAEYVAWAPAPPRWYWRAGAALAWAFRFYDPWLYSVHCARHRMLHPHVGAHVERRPVPPPAPVAAHHRPPSSSGPWRSSEPPEVAYGSSPPSRPVMAPRPSRPVMPLPLPPPPRRPVMMPSPSRPVAAPPPVPRSPSPPVVTARPSLSSPPRVPSFRSTPPSRGSGSTRDWRKRK